MGASAHRNADREREGLSGANLGFGLLERHLGLRGALAEWLRNGLQSRLHRFDSGRRLGESPAQVGFLFGGLLSELKCVPNVSPCSVRPRIDPLRLARSPQAA